MELSTSSTSIEPETLNFIYACAICGATFADTYEGHTDTVQGLSDGINHKDRLVTKLFLSECCHVFCGEHIDGGGPPFHPAGQKPKAPCPYCVQKEGDATLRDLYSVRGFKKDEYDPQIPRVWFSAPPMSLDGKGAEMDALRFQYIALARYCQTSYRMRKPLADALKKTRQDMATLQMRATEDHARVISLQHENKSLRAAAQRASDVNALRAEVQRLQHLEQGRDQFDDDVQAFRLLKADVRDLHVYRKNKSAILRYLKLLPQVVDQNTRMKERLSSLGFAMALEPVPNFRQLSSDDYNELEGIPEAYAEDDRQFQKSSSTHTAGRSAHNSGYPCTSSDRPLKRQRVDSPLSPDVQMEAPSRREMMPPPPSRSLIKMRSVRGLLPSIRKKFSHGRSAPKEPHNENMDVQMYDGGIWQDTANGHIDHGQTSPHHDLRSEPPYMSGALPVGDISQRPHLLANAAAHSDASHFSFRAPSPVKLSDASNGNQPVQLPSAPSYLRLMDGLVRDNNIELGLKDPRVNASNHHGAKGLNGHIDSTVQVQHQISEASSQQRWRLGHAFLHQSPKGTPRPPNSQQLIPPYGKPGGFFNRAHYDPSIRIETPDRTQPQRPDQQIQSVVSPFFGCDQYNTPLPPQPRITETQTSSHRFAASPLRRHRTWQEIPEWRESGGLNGLSFIDSPLDSRNGAITYKQHRSVPQRVPHRSYRDSGTSVPQSNANEPFDHTHRENTSSLQSRLTFSQQHGKESVSNVRQLSSFSKTPSRISHLPSSMPSIVLSQSPMRNRTQWDTLQRAGVRSSRRSHGTAQGASFQPPWTDPFKRIERRSVRR